MMSPGSRPEATLFKMSAKVPPVKITSSTATAASVPVSSSRNK
jgi:hypothetical protein